MEKEGQLELCKCCKNRNVDTSSGIFCNIYGDIPNFDNKCGGHFIIIEEANEVNKLLNQV